MALNNVTGGPNWKNSTNWLTDRPLGEWYGVTANSDGRVTELKLSRNALWGTIPAQVGNLSKLTVLDLVHNELTGPIPVELANLSDLQELQLSSNELTGPLPSRLGNLPQLRILTLVDNQLTGSIPPELGRLPRVETLNLSANELTGDVPPELGNLEIVQGPTCTATPTPTHPSLGADRAALVEPYNAANGARTRRGWSSRELVGSMPMRRTRTRERTPRVA